MAVYDYEPNLAGVTTIKHMSAATDSRPNTLKIMSIAYERVSMYANQQITPQNMSYVVIASAAKPR